MKKRGKNIKNVAGYFTVEASLVMPMVFFCYMAVVLMLCYIYERCIWEQNACRLPVWIKNVEGYMTLYSEEGDSDLREDICQYVQRYLEKEEESRYLFGTDARAEITWRGDNVRVKRKVVYEPLITVQEFELSVYSMKPVEYIRETEHIRGWLEREKGEKEEADDKE